MSGALDRLAKALFGQDVDLDTHVENANYLYRYLLEVRQEMAVQRAVVGGLTKTLEGIAADGCCIEENGFAHPQVNCPSSACVAKRALAAYRAATGT